MAVVICREESEHSSHLLFSRSMSNDARFSTTSSANLPNTSPRQERKAEINYQTSAVKLQTPTFPKHRTKIPVKCGCRYCTVGRLSTLIKGGQNEIRRRQQI
jgi:hypothetical protein